MNTPITRALERCRKRRTTIYNQAKSDERIIGLGSVILGRIREDTNGEALNALRLYSGLSESGELLIHKHVVGNTSRKSQYYIYLNEEATLSSEITTTSLKDSDNQKHELNSPEDFLQLEPEAVESLYTDLMKDGFWDRVAFKHAHQGKPGYENVWEENSIEANTHSREQLRTYRTTTPQ